ncbi:hypothetical protein DV737_g3246, partial [Chaetothyriales sp. CBS 132003]
MNGLTDGGAECPDTTTPFPDLDDEPDDDRDKDSRAKRRADYTPGHKRSISGNLLSKLTLLRTASGEQDKPDGGLGSAGGGAMAEAVQAQQKPRRRKGSLRKTVMGKGRDRKGSDIKNTKTSSPLAAAMASGATDAVARVDPQHPLQHRQHRPGQLIGEHRDWAAAGAAGCKHGR